MEKNNVIKKYGTMAVVFAAVFAIYNLIVMFLFNNKNGVFWAGYGFMCGAFVITVAILVYAFKNLKVEAAFMQIPLLSGTVFYFFAELFVSFVFMLFRGVAGVKLAVILQTILLLVYVIFAALAISAKMAVETVTQKVEQNVRTVKLLAVDVRLLEEQCLDAGLKNQLHKVAEAIEYSDPMTNEYVAELDELIAAKVKELKSYCNGEDKDAALGSCHQLLAYISERNQKLLLTK